MYMYIYIYVYLSLYISIYMSIYIYIERERHYIDSCTLPCEKDLQDLSPDLVLAEVMFRRF